MIPRKIVAIGASSCEGKVDIEGSGFVGRLRKWHEAKDQHNSVYNLGISGDTTRGMLQRIEAESKPRKPNLIIIQTGANDFSREGSIDAPTRVPFEEFTINLDKIITIAKSLADVLIMGIYPIDESVTTPVGWRPIYYLLKDVEKSAIATKDYCLKNNIPYVDSWEEWIKQDYKKYLYTDGLHANSLGHQTMFEALVTKLENIYG